jgi:chromosome segregation ATPase
MADEQVQTNPYHAALVASQEAYLGEVLGKYLDADARLRLASHQIKQLQDKLALFDQQAEQLQEAQDALNAMQTNKDAFEEQNEELKGTATTLMDEVNAIKAELEETRKERQAAQEKLLKVSEDTEERIASIEQRHSSEVERLKTERQHAMEREMKAKEQLSKAKKPAARRSRSPKSNEAVDGESSTAKKK